MKINDNKRIGAMNPYNKANENRSAGQVGKKDKPKDQIEISSEAKELLSTSGITKTPEHLSRLEELRDSVNAGTYRVDARKIAEKLLPYLQ
ncbi:flagellar biosynthesis anti-sigma factor FlgM [Paenibacillus sp. Soil766]|uniref:flagellar biosynthesis anti-sigma factor FlgM n=1 Tax=Paenibacillus sp. Soil766 TaxID=1736404 RepID=UPI00071047BB|nr:flagellar biosynthesis anti-sigma factor FlgM [Paenibacillus sp. Soil766]KRE97965.1 flagellar biosynthesis anti-sigma factor FlgM [Paenibacillus sp. Soil766]